MQTLTIRQPDDWHIHLRDGEFLDRTVADASKQFHRAIVMPNLVPPVKNAAQAIEYRERIMSALPEGQHFDPLMVLYLTDETTAEDIKQAVDSPFVHAAKLYPAGATTNSDSGVTDISKIGEVLAAMQEHGMPLLIHGEVTDHHIDIFDREKIFIERTLIPVMQKYPDLKIVLEHITTADAVKCVTEADHNIAATITAHHLLFNRNDMLVGGIRPHYFCLPILKRNIHQQALIDAATSGNPRFFLGTDSAPHVTGKKENSCGCAGCYTAPAAIELYAEAFEEANALDKLENFASVFGPQFYGMAVNESTITLQKQSWTMPETMTFGSETVTPLKAGEEVRWQVINGQ